MTMSESQMSKINTLLGLNPGVTTNSSQRNQIDLKKLPFNPPSKLTEVNAKLFKPHSTQFWVSRLVNPENAPPKFKYLKSLVLKAWTKKNKIQKFYKNLQNHPIYHLTICALKTVYVLHHYIFLGPFESISPKGFNVDEFVDFFHQVWLTRFNTNMRK